LKDVDSPYADELDDERTTYSTQSEGYLEVRNMNQAIIVKRGEGEATTLGESLVLGGPSEGGMYNDCAEAEAAYNALYGNSDNFTCGMSVPNFLTEGLTITEWIRFKDKVNGGTIFNFGNPTREFNPFGFKLETFVVNQNDYTDIPGEYFQEDDYARFVRLVVREGDGSLRDSHVGWNWTNGTRINTTTMTDIDDVMPDGSGGGVNPFNYTNIPIDFDEWYFIVATYNPLIKEDEYVGVGTYDTNTDYWLGNIDPENGDAYTHHSGYGAKCKVEIISQTDLLLARGYSLGE
jgi:hypothetical protein